MRLLSVMKPSLASEHAGVENPLFARENTSMLLGDANEVSDELLKRVQDFAPRPVDQTNRYLT